MSQQTQTLNIREYITSHLVDVFETMLSKKAVLQNTQDTPAYTDRVSGSVGFAGETVTGAVYLHLTGPFAVRATSAMLGLAIEEITGQAETNDVVGEMTNMLAGGLKSALCDAGAPCAVSTPTIIRGTSFMVEPMPNVERIAIVFDCENEPVMAEIHVKYT
jgi:chemotaxis protein CheX